MISLRTSISRLSGAPAGTVSSVNPARVAPPATATLSITGSSGVAPGHYPLVLTASAGSIVKTLDFDLAYAPRRRRHRYSTHRSTMRRTST